MQKLAKNGTVEAYTWLTADKGVALDLGQIQTGKHLIHAKSYIENFSKLEKMENIGVWLDSDDSIETLKACTLSLNVIAINFPVFADGRGFSLAQQLRADLNYRGEILAIGHFMEEQLFYLKRCGFDGFIVADDSNIDTLKEILNDFSNNYQGSSIEPRPLYRRK